jgi:phage terminase small subunit
MSVIRLASMTPATSLMRPTLPIVLQDGLTAKQRAFADHWVKCHNATEAARVAGYAGTDETLGQVGYENLRKPEIVDYINQLMPAVMPAGEVLQRLSKHGRADLADVVENDGSIDLKAAKQRGVSDLVKKLKVTRTRTTNPETGEITEEIRQDVELHDAQAALVHLGRFHKLFVDRVETTNVNIDVSVDVSVETALASILTD